MNHRCCYQRRLHVEPRGRKRPETRPSPPYLSQHDSAARSVSGSVISWIPSRTANFGVGVYSFWSLPAIHRLTWAGVQTWARKREQGGGVLQARVCHGHHLQGGVMLRSPGRKRERFGPEPQALRHDYAVRFPSDSFYDRSKERAIHEMIPVQHRRIVLSVDFTVVR